MEPSNSLYQFLIEKEFSVPLLEMIIFVIFNSVCLLFGRFRLGLLISYCFVFYWGFLFNMEYFVNMLGNTTWGMFIYAISGFLMFVVAILGFLLQSSTS